MTSPVGVGDVIAITGLCVKVARLIQVAKEAPAEYESFVLPLNSTHAVFKCIAERVIQVGPEHVPEVDEKDEDLQRCLSQEIAFTTREIDKACSLLVERYAIHANTRSLRNLVQRLRWGSTVSRFEKCLREVDRHQSRILALIGSEHISLARDLNQSVAAIRLHINDRPPPLGVPGSGGVPKDHVHFRVGVGPDTTLLLDLCSGSEKLHKFLEILFDDLPGKKHICKGHYKLYCDTNAHQPKELTDASWPHLIGSGSTIKLAFVVGTLQMSPAKFCPGCNRENNGGWDTWQSCRCGYSYLVTETDAVDYQAIDGWWQGEAKDLNLWKRGQVERDESSRTTSGDRPKRSIMHQLWSSQAAPLKTDALAPESGDAAYFRCIFMVHDPAFNLVCRNVFCRCILGMTSRTSKAPRMEIVSTVPCPKHTSPGIRPLPQSVLPKIPDCDDDPYFDRFGGYEDFIRTIRYIYGKSMVCLFLDMDKLPHADDHGAEAPLQAILTHLDAVTHYRSEVLNDLQGLWGSYVKPALERKGSEQNPHAERWLSAEEHDIELCCNLLKEPKVESATEVDDDNVSSGKLLLEGPEGRAVEVNLLEYSKLVPCLNRGRLTLETLEDYAASDDLYCAVRFTTNAGI